MPEPTSCCAVLGGYCDRCDLLVGLDGLRVVGVDRARGAGRRGRSHRHRNRDNYRLRMWRSLSDLAYLRTARVVQDLTPVWLQKRETGAEGG